jgi:hypothetical protein
MDDAMADLLLSIVGSSSEPQEVRASAAISLGPALEEADIESSAGGSVEDASIGEEMFARIQRVLHGIYLDEAVPTKVRRRVLEASVRAPQDWHTAAIRFAAASDDEDWKLSAAFCMRWVPGFDAEILDMLESRNPDIHYEAVGAAGAQEVIAAWPHIRALLASEGTERRLLLAAIEAAGAVGDLEAGTILTGLAGSADEEIAEAASEALMMREAMAGEDDDEDSPF